MRGSMTHAAVVSLMVGLGVGLTACNRGPPVKNQATGDTGNVSRPVARAAVLEPEPVLGRAQLLAAAHDAASAYTAGHSLRAEAAELAGREFAIVISFACPGAEPSEAQAGLSWSHDAEEERLRLRAEPTIDRETAPIGAVGANVEAVEGFWIPRAWTNAEDCPPPQGTVADPRIQVQPTPHTVAIAQFFTVNDSRTRQRAGRAYETVERIEAEQLPNEQGFRFVVAGRVTATASGGTIVCHSPGVDVRPTCLIAVNIDRVSFVNPKTGTTLASWEPR